MRELVASVVSCPRATVLTGAEQPDESVRSIAR